MGILSEESLAKPALALIDVSGSATREMIESQLLFTLSFAGKAGGLVGFFDTQLRSELMPLTAQTVGRLMAGEFPGGGGTDLGAAKAALDSLPSGRGPMRVALFSDWYFDLPQRREELGLLKEDELFLLGDCMGPQATQTEEMLAAHRSAGRIPDWIQAWGSHETQALASEAEALEIAKSIEPGAPATRSSLTL